jgi:hypothetical protein
MTILTALLALTMPVQDGREVMEGLWKVDQKFGLALEAAKYEKPLDWDITFKKDGTFLWVQYDPFVEGVGRNHRDIKGTYIVVLDEGRLILKTDQLTGQRVALQCVISKDRRTFVLPQKDPKQADRNIRFVKVVPEQGRGGS